MSRWAHWLSTWNRICHCSFVSNRSFLLFSNEYLILWIGGRNFLFSLYFPRFFFLYFAGGDFEIATSIISRFTAHENEIPYHIFGLFYIHIFVDNLSDKRLISLEPRCQAFWLCLRDSPNSLFLLGSLDGVDKTWLIQLQTGRNLDTEECANYSIL